LQSKTADIEYGSSTKADEKYILFLNTSADDGEIKIVNDNNEEIISVPLQTLFGNINNIDSDSVNVELPANKMTFDFENSAAKLRVIFKSVSISDSKIELAGYADAYVLFAIK